MCLHSFRTPGVETSFSLPTARCWPFSGDRATPLRLAFRWTRQVAQIRNQPCPHTTTATLSSPLGPLGLGRPGGTGPEGSACTPTDPIRLPRAQVGDLLVVCMASHVIYLSLLYPFRGGCWIPTICRVADSFSCCCYLFISKLTKSLLLSCISFNYSYGLISVKLCVVLIELCVDPRFFF